MKLTKGLFLAFAGLGLFACSNEDVAENNGIQGKANVAVQIRMGDISRAAGTPTSGTTAQVAGSMTVTLDALRGGATKTITIGTDDTDNGVDWTDKVVKVVFAGVENPQSVEVKVNGYDGTAITTLAAANDAKWSDLKAPMYGKNAGVVEYDEQDKVGKIVRLENGNYETAMTLTHEVGRLEFSGIQHAHEADADCWFKPGIKLAKVSLWKADGDAVVETPFTATEFTTTATFPTTGCYAYNVVENTLPELRLEFSDVEFTDEKLAEENNIPWDESGIGYAAIKQYKLADDATDDLKTLFGAGDDNVITQFPAGYVFKVTDLKVYDKNIHEGDPSGEGVQLTATITVTPWTVVSGTAEWH